MRGVRCARCEVGEEGPVRRERLLVADPGDSLVGHVGQEVVVRVLGQFDRVCPVVDERRPLVGLTAQEPVELVEALPAGPAVERTRDAGLPGGELVPLSEGRRAVAVQPQHLGERSHAAGDLARVARERRARLDDGPHVADVVVATALESRPGRRAYGRRVEVVVVEPALGESIERGRRHGPAEGLGPGESQVVDEHDKHVRRALGSLHLEVRRGRRIAHVRLRRDRALGHRDGKDVPVQRRRLPAGGRRHAREQHDRRKSQEHAHELHVGLLSRRYLAGPATGRPRPVASTPSAGPARF